MPSLTARVARMERESYSNMLRTINCGRPSTLPIELDGRSYRKVPSMRTAQPCRVFLISGAEQPRHDGSISSSRDQCERVVAVPPTSFGPGGWERFSRIKVFRVASVFAKF